MEELERQVRDRDELIRFLNDERLRQSRIIATQSELIGRRNRSIDQLHHMRRVSVVTRQPDAQTSQVMTERKRFLLSCASKAILRPGLPAALLLPLIGLALSYINGEPVRVIKRRHRSLPSRTETLRQEKGVSPPSSPVFSCHSEGDTPSGGFDLELVYYSKPSQRKLTPLKFTTHLPLMAELSPRLESSDASSAQIEFVDISGRYNTPLGETTISRDASGLFSGVWGAQTAVFSVLSQTELSAKLSLTGRNIQGRRNKTTGSISWTGGQIWTLVESKTSRPESMELAGRWTWGGEPHIVLGEESSEGRFTGTWGVHNLQLSLESEKVKCELSNGLVLHGQLGESKNSIRWGNGQKWTRMPEEGVQRIRSG